MAASYDGDGGGDGDYNDDNSEGEARLWQQAGDTLLLE